MADTPLLGVATSVGEVVVTTQAMDHYHPHSHQCHRPFLVFRHLVLLLREVPHHRLRRRLRLVVVVNPSFCLAKVLVFRELLCRDFCPMVNLVTMDRVGGFRHQRGRQERDHCLGSSICGRLKDGIDSLECPNQTRA